MNLMFHMTRILDQNNSTNLLAIIDDVKIVYIFIYIVSSSITLNVAGCLYPATFNVIELHCVMTM